MKKIQLKRNVLDNNFKLNFTNIESENKTSDWEYNMIIDNISISLDNFIERPTCGHTEEINLLRYIYTSFASIIAAIGLFLNILLLWIFIKKLYNKNGQSFFYPIFLAILDCLICVLFIFIFGIDVFAGFNKIEALFIIYHQYIIIVFILSKVTQLSIPYILILSIFERYASITQRWKESKILTIKIRSITLILCLTLCIVLKIPSMFSIVIEIYPKCTNSFRKLAVDISDFAKNSKWYPIYDFQIMCFIQQVIPFITILCLNLLIVKKLSRNSRRRMSEKIIESSCVEESLTSFAVSHLQVLHYQNDKKVEQKIGNAVYSTLAICFSYLICNGAHLVLTILERTNSSLLINKDDITKASLFYTTFGDLVSFLYMFTSAIRFLIYYKFNNKIKSEVRKLFYLKKSEPRILKHAL
uniref:G_PROTEIN_RECEP_F1_2 domain-containing protein n=1 Tax=Parastrongyloides trichosuri TaxID=131310 RepID=A0A0N4Z6M5_PARTI